MKPVVVIIVGTRPEAIKLAPLYRALETQGSLRPLLLSTSQHRELLKQALAPFKLEPEIDLKIMTEGQTPSRVASEVLSLLPPLLEKLRPAWVVVQGDTTTAFAAATAAFYCRVPVAHVEAGLRSFRMDAPFPEEFNRKAVAVACSLHLAPTPRARDNLLGEGVLPDNVAVVGNTIVDAVQWILGTLPPQVPDGKKRLLVTLHRRESFGGPLLGLLKTLRTLVERHWPEVEITYPVHPNPNVRGPAQEILGGVKGVFLVPPMDYPDFLQAFRSSRVVLSDSGGVQEEAPTLGVPVLIAREVTERPEAVESGWAHLVGTDPRLVMERLEQLLFDDEALQRARGTTNPFGDGRAAERIAELLMQRTRGGDRCITS